MKIIVFYLVPLLVLLGVSPAVSSEAEGLGPTGLLEAQASGFDGSNFEFAVVGESFQLESIAVSNAVMSEACFQADRPYSEKCENSESQDLGPGASRKSQIYTPTGDRLIFSITGSKDGVAPRSKAHTIRTSDLTETFPKIIEHALDIGVDAVFFVDRWQSPSRGFEISCDSIHPQSLAAAKLAQEMGVALFSEPGSGGSPYGLSFPSCLTGVVPVGALDSKQRIGNLLNLGPGVVLAHTYFKGLSAVEGGRDITGLYPGGSGERALAVVGGIFAALLHSGATVALALESLKNSAQTIDDLFVKDIPVANYRDASSWLEAQSSRNATVKIEEITQVGTNRLAVALDRPLEKLGDYRVTAVEIYSKGTRSWTTTAISKTNAQVFTLETEAESGWLRAILTSSTGSIATLPEQFRNEKEFQPDYSIRTPSATSGLLIESEHPKFSGASQSFRVWPELTDPALKSIELEYARDMQVSGKGVTVAIIDDGFMLEHPYLQGGRVLEGLCLQKDNSCPNSSNKQLGVNAVDPKDSSDDHGTMVAGTIGGRPFSGANGGIAPDVTFIVARVDLNGRDENGDFVVQALEWIYQHSFEYNIAAVNMSFGHSRPEREQILGGAACKEDPDFEAVAAKLELRGVASVVASGNDGLVLGHGGPACEASAISVGAVDNDGSIIGYSNISEDVDIVAPARTLTSFGDSQIREGGGTSNATPVVTGAFALAREMRPELTVDEILFAMRESANLVDDIYVKDIPSLNIKKFLEYLSPGSKHDQLRPTLSVKGKGQICSAIFDIKSAGRADLRFRPVGTSTWSRVIGVTSPHSLANLSPEAKYEIEVGSMTQEATLWSDREICGTEAAKAPDAIADYRSEERGNDWAIIHLEDVENNGSPLKHLLVVDSTGARSKAISLGAGFYFLQVPAEASNLQLAFENSVGAAPFALVAIPEYDPVPFSTKFALNGFTGSSLSSAQKTKINSELGKLAGISKFTCVGYFTTKATKSAKSLAKARATSACSEAKKLHPKAAVVIKTLSTGSKPLVGVVEVTADGAN